MTNPSSFFDPFDLYTPLRDLLDHLEVEGFVKPGQRELLHWCRTVMKLLRYVTANEAQSWRSQQVALRL